MATSGSFNTNSIGDFYLTFSWNRTGYNSSENKHYIHYSVVAHNTKGKYRTVYAKKLIINGTTIFEEAGTSGNGKAYYDGDTITSGDITINSYNAAGDGTISASFEGGVGSYPGTNASGNNSWSLDRIPRYATITKFNIIGRTSTSISAEWTTDVYCDVIDYSLNGGSWVNFASNGIFTINNLSPNTNYSLKIRLRRQDSQLYTESDIKTIRTYASTNPTISLYSRTSSSVTVNSNCNVSVSSTQYRIRPSYGNYGNYQDSNTFYNLSPDTNYIIEVKKIGADSGETGTATISVNTYQRTIPNIWLSSKKVNSIVVNSNCNVSVSSTQYRIRPSYGNYGNYQDSNTFYDLYPDTDYIIEVKKVGTDSGESGTATLSVKTYDIARITSAPDINLGDSARITKTNPSSTYNAVRIETLNPTTNIAVRDVNTSNDMTIVFTDSELDELYKKLGNNNSITIRYVVDTKVYEEWGVTTYYHWVDRTCTLTGNQKTIKTKVNNNWNRGKIWTNVLGTWKRAVIWTNINGTWKRGG